MTSYLQQAVCVRRNKKHRKITEKSRPTENTPRDPQPPSDLDLIDTERVDTHPTRSPTLARFQRSRDCGNRPRKALAISKNDECYTHTDTDKLNNGTLYAPRYEDAFFLEGKKRPRSLPSLGLASLLVERYLRQGCLVLAVGRVRSK